MKWKEINTENELDAALDQQIRETRVHKFQIRLVDALGNPIPRVLVKAVHKNHDFVFGICPNGHISMTNHLACKEGEDAETYWKLIGDLFNGTTLWWAWKVLEPRSREHSFQCEVNGFGPMERMVKRAENLGHKITAHAILYPNQDVCPDWLSSCTEEEALLRFEEHVKETVTKYRGRIGCWHPVNEAYDKIQSIWNLNINEGLVYKWIKELAPTADLVDNGGYTINPDFYEKGIQNAQLFGSKVDDVGIRGYFELYNSQALTFYQKLWEHFENLTSRYKKGIRFTEIGAVSAPRKGKYLPWHVDHTIAGPLGITNLDEYRQGQPINEETQAVFLSRLYRLLFAHPKVKEGTYWDLCDTYTWNEVEGGLIRPDFSVKPAYMELKKLIHDTWKTEAAVESNGEGVCEFSGFDGEYEVEIKGKKYKVHMNKNESETVLCC